MKSRGIFIFISIFAAGVFTGWILRGRALASLRAAIAGKPLPSWTWCSRDVAEVTALPSQKKFTDPVELKILCTATVEDEGFSAPPSLKAVYKASGPSGQTTFLEYAGDGVFRADGKVFRSRAFEDAMSSRR